MDSWQLKQILELNIYFVDKTTSSVKLWSDYTEISQWLKWLHCTCICLQMSVYSFSEKGKKDSRNLSHVWNFFIENECALKMNAHWKWTRILKKNHILKTKAHSETHFEILFTLVISELLWEIQMSWLTTKSTFKGI